MNGLTRFVLQLPVFYVMNRGCEHLGYGIIGQIALTVFLLVIYDLAERTRYEKN